MNKDMKANEKIEGKVVACYKAIENAAVSGYKAVENGVVGGYKKVEDKFVNSFFGEDPRPKAEADAETDESK